MIIQAVRIVEGGLRKQYQATFFRSISVVIVESTTAKNVVGAVVRNAAHQDVQRLGRYMQDENIIIQHLI